MRPAEGRGRSTVNCCGSEVSCRSRAAERDDERAPCDRAAQRRRDPKRQACLDRALDVVDEGLSRLPVAFEMGEGDARGLPKIEPSRFIISMIVSREPAGPTDLPLMQALNWR